MKIILALMALISNLNAEAFFERQVSGAASNRPLGLVLTVGIAYNYKIWDDSETTFWKYGYIRPKVTYDTSFLVNTAMTELQVYPVSIFGFAVGSSYAYRSVKKNEEYDCDQVSCKSELHRNYFRTNLNLGAGNFISSLSYQVEHYYISKDDNLPSLDLGTLLLLPKKNGLQEKMVAFLGYKATEFIDVGVLEMRNQVIDPSTDMKTKSEGQYIVARLKDGDFKYMGGIGTFGTDYNEKSLAAIFKVIWVIDPTLSLAD
ncbi:MAG: hypothetical protein H7235_00985 [Bdellovibrionaceae bacterium]|nr:hypothetical protein [Pseudobdellovibrionaceae bacterium]